MPETPSSPASQVAIRLRETAAEEGRDADDREMLEKVATFVDFLFDANHVLNDGIAKIIEQYESYEAVVPADLYRIAKGTQARFQAMLDPPQ